MPKRYKMPITYKNIEDEDILLEKSQLNHYKDEIEHFKKTSELYISLFSNSKRLHRENGKLDHVQLIAVRIFQDTRVAFILALKGMYPQAASLLRGSLESINLIYDFVINPEHEDLWFDAGKNKRAELFKTGTVRKRVDEANIINL